MKLLGGINFNIGNSLFLVVERTLSTSRGSKYFCISVGVATVYWPIVHFGKAYDNFYNSTASGNIRLKTTKSCWGGGGVGSVTFCNPGLG